MKKLNETELKGYLKEYDIESIEEFTPEFYISNLTNGGAIEKQAIKNLYARGYSKEELIQIENYKETGIVEYVADDRFYIEDNMIIAEE